MIEKEKRQLAEISKLRRELESLRDQKRREEAALHEQPAGPSKLWQTDDRDSELVEQMDGVDDSDVNEPEIEEVSSEFLHPQASQQPKTAKKRDMTLKRQDSEESGSSSTSGKCTTESILRLMEWIDHKAELNTVKFKGVVSKIFKDERQITTQQVKQLLDLMPAADQERLNK